MTKEELKGASMIIAELEPYADEHEFEDFTYYINEHFSKHLEKQVYVEGKNLTWRNLTGTKSFTLNKTDQIWEELVPINTDFSFRIETTEENNVYQARCAHHDCPTGEKFKIFIAEEEA